MKGEGAEEKLGAGGAILKEPGLEGPGWWEWEVAAIVL